MESNQGGHNEIPRESETIEEVEESDKDETNNNESSEVGGELRKRRKVWSNVWEHYKRVLLVDKTADAFCNYCRKKYNVQGRNGTSKLRYHTNNCVEYKKKMKKVKDVKQIFLKAGDVQQDGTMELTNFVFDQEAARQAFARAVIVHELPFTIITYTFFKIFLKVLNPAFKPVSRTTLKEDCMREYRIEKNKLYKALEALDCRVSITSDMWTSDQNKSYMSLTCHYIDDRWRLKKRIIAFCLVEGSHTGKVIAEEIHKRLFEWNIDRKIFSIALDNASANNSAILDLIDILSRKNALLLDGSFVHVRCCAHILNLVVQYGLVEIRSTVNKIRESVKYVKYSPQRQNKFDKVADQVRAPKRQLVLDVSTKWNSTYSMLEVALLFKDAFSRYAEIEKGYICEPSSDEWANANIFCDFLKWFQDLTNLFCSTTTPTSNLYFVEICELHLMLVQGSKNENQLLASLSKKMLEKFMKYWGEISPVFAIASILDPQIKKKSIEWYYPLIYGDEGELKIIEVVRRLENLYAEYNNCSPHGNIEQSLVCETTMSTSVCTRWSHAQGNVGTSISSALPSRIRSGFSQFLEQSSLNQPIKSDLEMYLDEANHPPQMDFDILSWWKLNSPKYPIVSLMARDILAIPTTTVASESAFSTGGRVLDQYRCSMHESTVEALICAQDWIRSDFQESGCVTDRLAILGAFISKLDLDDGLATSSTPSMD